MTQDTSIMYWHTNKDWYETDDLYEYIYRLRDNVPDRAKESYEKWLQHQKINNYD